MVMKPSSLPSDPSSLRKGSYDPSEEGVIGSSGGGESLDPDDGEATITPLMTLRRVGIGDEDREVEGEHWGEGRTGDVLPSTLPAQCQEPTFTDDFKLYFSDQLPHFLSSSFLSHDHSSSKQDKTFISNEHWYMVLYYLRLNYCSGPSWSTSSPKSSSSPITRDKLRSLNSSSRALSATSIATISREPNSPLAIRRPRSCIWTV